MSTACPECGSEYTHENRRLGLWECEDCGHDVWFDESRIREGDD